MSQKKLFTLVFALKDTQILLGLKKRGFGKDKWNGFGGKIEPGETLRQAAVREMQEECGIVIEENNLNHLGHLEFTFQDEPTIMVVKVFSTYTFKGNPVETEEMKPKWFNLAAIPFSNMWPDDRIWFPYMLKGTHFAGTFWFRGHTEILRHEVKKISEDDLASLVSNVL